MLMHVFVDFGPEPIRPESAVPVGWTEQFIIHRVVQKFGN
jgi:hypothetical protein